jgi:hypothetical protein
MTQLGKAIGILVAAQMRELEMHEDVVMFHAPSECHALVARGEGKRLRAARRHALHVAGVRSLRQLRSMARRAMGNDAPIYRRYGFVPY